MLKRRRDSWAWVRGSPMLMKTFLKEEYPTIAQTKVGHFLCVCISHCYEWYNALHWNYFGEGYWCDFNIRVYIEDKMYCCPPSIVFFFSINPNHKRWITFNNRKVLKVIFCLLWKSKNWILDPRERLRRPYRSISECSEFYSVSCEEVKIGFSILVKGFGGLIDRQRILWRTSWSAIKARELFSIVDKASTFILRVEEASKIFPIIQTCSGGIFDRREILWSTSRSSRKPRRLFRSS